MGLNSRWLILIWLVVSLSACVERPVEPLRLGSNVWPGFEPLYLARHQHYIDNHKIRLVEYASASQVTQAFRHHLIDAAVVSLDESLLLLQSGENLSIVLMLDQSNGGHGIVAKASLRSVSDLAGKRVGVENTALGAFVLSCGLEMHQMQVSGVEIVSLDINQQLDAFKADAIDALVTFEPQRSQLIEAGGHVIWDSRQMTSEIFTVLVVRNEYLAHQPQVVQHLIAGCFQALTLIEREPIGSADILRRRMGLNIEQTLAVYQQLKFLTASENRQYLLEKGAKLVNTLKQLERVMKHKGLVYKALPVEELVPSYQIIYPEE